MAAAEMIERFSKLPFQHKILGFVFVSVFIGLIFYFMFYSGVVEAVERQENKIRQMEAEKATLENKKRQYLAFRGEVSKLLETQKELLKVLPSKSEIHTLLQSIHAQAELAGLNILIFEQRPEVKEQYYARIPVTMKISGSFHQVNKFFYSVGHLKRIVNVHNLSLKMKKLGKASTGKLSSQFTVSTFRFLNKLGGGKKPRRGRKR